MKTEHIPSNWTITEDRYNRIVCHDEKDIQRCGGKKRNGEPCKSRPKKGNVRCIKKHNGNAPKGIASHRFVDGIHSRYMDYMPQNLTTRFEDAKNDRDLKNIDNTIALLDMQLYGLLGDIEEGDFGTHYAKIAGRYYKVASLLAKFKRQPKNEDVFIELEDNIADLGQLIETGQKQFQTRQEIRTVIQDKTKLIKTQSDIHYQGEKAITVRELGDFMGMLNNILMRADLSRDQLRVISDGITTLWDRNDTNGI